MSRDIMRLSYPEQVAEEACIKEIKLRFLALGLKGANPNCQV